MPPLAPTAETIRDRATARGAPACLLRWPTLGKLCLARPQPSWSERRAAGTIGYADLPLGPCRRVAVGLEFCLRPFGGPRPDGAAAHAVYHRRLGDRRRAAADLGHCDDANQGRLSVAG